MRELSDNDEYNAPPSGVSIPSDNQQSVTFRNNDGDWTIWKGCFNVNGTTIGPGYIGKLVSGGKTVLNDQAGAPGGLNAMRGGLGTFGFHYTRGNAPYPLDHPSLGRFTTDISNRHCSSGGSSGVYQVDIRQGPSVIGGVGVFDVTVWLRDQWGNTGAGPAGHAGIKLDYDIRVLNSVVQHFATVTTYFGPNYEGTPYVKEPKFIGGVPNSQAGYRRISIYGGTSGTEPIKTFTGNLPQGSRHAYENNRLRVRYDFGTSTTIGSHGCNGTIKPCLNVLFRSAPLTGDWSLWEGANAGLDRWALDAAARPRSRSRTTRTRTPTTASTPSGTATAPTGPLPTPARPRHRTRRESAAGSSAATARRATTSRTAT